MSLRQTILDELRVLNIKPDKSLGQNFLVEEKTYKDIVSAAEIEKGEIVLEIGPGLGTLTRFLLDAGARVTAVEKDRELAEYVARKFTNEERAIIKEGDILNYDIASLDLKKGEYKIVANIPYYITSHLLRIIFEQWPQPKKIVLLVQKEVADRITVKSKRWSLLAVSVAYFAQAKTIKRVPAGQFHPSPDVDSALIVFTPHAITDSSEYTKAFFDVARAGFSEKRKQLINNLSKGLHLAREEIFSLLGQCGIDPRRRAETLSIPEWRTITEHFLLLP